MTPVKSPSSIPSRRARAHQTRLRMIRAAHELFVQRGYSGATMTEIAAAAGVAVQTVYFTFHAKGELLQACYDHAVLGDEDPTPPMEQPWYAALITATTASEALGHFVHGNTSIVARVGALDDIVRSALHEPEAVAVRAHSERLRRDGYRSVAEHLSRHFGLAPGLDVDTATDVMLTLGGAAPYCSLVLDYGWDRTRFEEWVHSVLVGQLLPTPT